MKILSEKQTICTTIKVLYENGENFYEDIDRKKKDGWNPVKKPNFYDENMEMVIKHASNGTVITYIRYENID